MKIIILAFMMVGCASSSEIQKRDDKIKRLEQALMVRTAWSEFWYEAFEQCAQNNYAEAKAQEDYDVSLELAESCH